MEEGCERALKDAEKQQMILFGWRKEGGPTQNGRGGAHVTPSTQPSPEDATWGSAGPATAAQPEETGQQETHDRR